MLIADPRFVLSQNTLLQQLCQSPMEVQPDDLDEEFEEDEMTQEDRENSQMESPQRANTMNSPKREKGLECRALKGSRRGSNRSRGKQDSEVSPETDNLSPSGSPHGDGPARCGTGSTASNASDAHSVCSTSSAKKGSPRFGGTRDRARGSVTSLLAGFGAVLTGQVHHAGGGGPRSHRALKSHRSARGHPSKDYRDGHSPTDDPSDIPRTDTVDLYPDGDDGVRRRSSTRRTSSQVDGADHNRSFPHAGMLRGVSFPNRTGVSPRAADQHPERGKSGSLRMSGKRLSNTGGGAMSGVSPRADGRRGPGVHRAATMREPGGSTSARNEDGWGEADGTGRSPSLRTG